MHRCGPSRGEAGETFFRHHFGALLRGLQLEKSSRSRILRSRPTRRMKVGGGLDAGAERRRRWPIASLLLLLATGAGAQQSPLFPDLPGSRPLPAELPSEPSDEILSRTPMPTRALDPAIAPGPRIYLAEVAVDGNTVLPAPLLAKVLAPFLKRELSSEDLETLREAVTQLYVRAGYVNSRARLPDQDFRGAVLRVECIEGHLADVVISGNRGYRDRYLRARLGNESGTPVNTFAIERRLRALEAEPGIRSVRAVLRPGLNQDESVLYVEVSESDRLLASLEVGNVYSPLIGEEGGHMLLSYLNPLGLGDWGGATLGLSEGLTDIVMGYGLPLTRRGTRMALEFRYSESRFVEEPIADLDIESRYLTAAVDLSQPLRLGERGELILGVRTEWRESHSTVGGFDFRFSDAADARGYVRDFVFRIYQSWSRRSSNNVLAFRSTWSLGVDALDATSGGLESAEFTAWLGQAQWLHRIESNGLEFVARATFQWASDPLLSFERFSVGGFYSVRGYRENQLVRDNGYALGLEARLPLMRSPSGRTILRAGPFMDVGRAWNHAERIDIAGQNLASIGANLAWSPHPKWFFEFSYGIRLIDLPNQGESSLQDHGIAFRISARAF